MLDTLKLAQSLERGGFTKEMAEATAAALNDAIADQVATKSDIDRLEAKIDSKWSVLIWVVGINAAATLTMLVKHW